MDKLKDNDIREALCRRETKRRQPEVPDDFCDKVLAGIETPPSSQRKWTWIAVAACLLLLIGVGVTTNLKDHSTSDQTKRTAKVESKPEKMDIEVIPQKTEPTEQPSSIQPQPVSEDKTTKTERTVEKVGTRPQKHTESKNLPSNPDEEPETIEPMDILRKVQEATPITETPAQVYTTCIPKEDTTIDSTYISPSKVDEFIAKLADYYDVDPITLPCLGRTDSTVVSKAYVFPDNDEVKLFSRLLQVACRYKDDTPGYLLNFSHRQFFFTLDDSRKGMKHLWIAERIGDGRILLYSTRSPKSTNVPSDCYRKYREQLTNTSTREL